MRDLVVVLHDTIRNAIHFCSTELQGDDRWFAFSGSSVDLFVRVESIMVRNRIATNVTAVTYLRTSGSTVEYSVVFNPKLTGERMNEVNEASPANKVSDVERVVSRLQAGWTLTNRGTGWWLAEPAIPYKRTHSELVADEIVNKLEMGGVVRLDMPYTSIKATLIGG